MLHCLGQAQHLSATAPDPTTLPLHVPPHSATFSCIWCTHYRIPSSASTPDNHNQQYNRHQSYHHPHWWLHVHHRNMTQQTPVYCMCSLHESTQLQKNHSVSPQPEASHFIHNGSSSLQHGHYPPHNNCHTSVCRFHCATLQDPSL